MLLPVIFILNFTIGIVPYTYVSTAEYTKLYTCSGRWANMDVPFDVPQRIRQLFCRSKCGAWLGVVRNNRALCFTKFRKTIGTLIANECKCGVYLNQNGSESDKNLGICREKEVIPANKIFDEIGCQHHCHNEVSALEIRSGDRTIIAQCEMSDALGGAIRLNYGTYADNKCVCGIRNAIIANEVSSSSASRTSHREPADFEKLSKYPVKTAGKQITTSVKCSSLSRELRAGKPLQNRKSSVSKNVSPIPADIIVISSNHTDIPDHPDWIPSTFQSTPDKNRESLLLEMNESLQRDEKIFEVKPASHFDVPAFVARSHNKSEYIPNFQNVDLRSLLSPVRKIQEPLAVCAIPKPKGFKPCQENKWVSLPVTLKSCSRHHINDCHQVCDGWCNNYYAYWKSADHIHCYTDRAHAVHYQSPANDGSTFCGCGARFYNENYSGKDRKNGSHLCHNVKKTLKNMAHDSDEADLQCSRFCNEYSTYAIDRNDQRMLLRCVKNSEPDKYPYQTYLTGYCKKAKRAETQLARMACQCGVPTLGDEPTSAQTHRSDLPGSVSSSNVNVIAKNKISNESSSSSKRSSLHIGGDSPSKRKSRPHSRKKFKNIANLYEKTRELFD